VCDEFGLGLLGRSFMALVVAYDLRHEVSMCAYCLSLCIYPMKRCFLMRLYLLLVRERPVDVPRF